MKYKHRFIVQAPQAIVAAFHQNSLALRKLTPPPVWVQFHQVQPLAEGSIADFTMWLGPLPVRWTAVHSQVSRHGFTDTQQHGPFQFWQHNHTFHDLGNGRTEIVDEIQAEPGSLISRLMWLNLPVLFAYRAWRTRRALKNKGNYALPVQD